MKTQLRWKKGTFSNTYEIFSNNRIIGNMKNKTFSQSSNGELNGKKYFFKTSGFFKHHTEIFNSEDDSLVGQITYNSWMTKAVLTINDKTINWKYNNIWNTKWSLFDDKGLEINYSGTSTKGNIDSNTDDELLLLSGLFVTNYYWQMTVVAMLVIFIPILTPSTN